MYVISNFQTQNYIEPPRKSLTAKKILPKSKIRPNWLQKVDSARISAADLDISFLSSPSSLVKEGSWSEARLIVHTCQPHFSLMPSLYNRIKLEEDLGTFEQEYFSVEKEEELDLLRQTGGCSDEEEILKKEDP